MLVARMSSSSPMPGGSSRSTTATPPSTLRTAFIVLLVGLTGTARHVAPDRFLSLEEP